MPSGIPVAAILQVWQVPVHGLPQQMLSTQLPDTQSVPSAQGPPFSDFVGPSPPWPEAPAIP
jgi:hypothetical protein